MRFRRVWPLPPGDRVTFCSPIRWPNTFPAVTWRFTAGPSNRSAVLIPNTIRPATMSIFVGVCSNPVASSLSVRPRFGFTVTLLLFQKRAESEAESLLRFKHLIFFGPTGTAKWRGQIYGAPRFSWFIDRPVIYHGVFGEGFFQSMYATPQSDLAAYLSSIEWFALTLFLFGLGIFLPTLRIVPYLMFGGTLCVALSYMVRAQIEPKFDTVHARLLVMLLAFVQPLVRGWSRYFTWLRFKRTPVNVIRRHEHLPERARAGGILSRRIFWSEQGSDRHYLLGSLFQLLDEEGWRYSTDTGWNEWDIQIYGNFWWSVALQTVTEYHGGGKCL